MPNLMRIMYYLAAAQRRLYWHKDKLRRFQEKRLRSVVNYAYHFVPFYNEKFKEANISPSEVKTLDDLSKLPIVKKDEVRIVDPRRLVSVEFDLQRLKVVRTSGSTGKPFQVYLTRSEDDWRKAIYMRANINCGQKPRDRWVAITSPRHSSETTNIQRRLGVFAQTCVSVFADVNEQMRLVNEADPDILDGYSGSLLLLARAAQRTGLETIKPRLIFGTAELIDSASVKLIESVFNAPFYDQFGCVEVDRTAWQCPEKVGYHMDVDSVITQFVDSEGDEVSLGEEGEVVYTSLFNYAMPFIRYSVGDVGEPSNDLCPCGRNLPLMKVVEGRKDSFIVLPDDRVLSPRMFTVAMSMFKRYQGITRFRIVQKRLDYFEFFIKKKDDSIHEKVMEKELIEHFSRMLSIEDGSIKFKIKFVDEVPINKSGKLMAIVSEVKL